MCPGVAQFVLAASWPLGSRLFTYAGSWSGCICCRRIGQEGIMLSSAESIGSLKPSVRYRNAGAPSSVLQSAGSNGVINGAPVGNGHVNHLRNELFEFEKEDFDAQAYVQAKCQSMSEKGIRNLCDDLLDLKKSSAEEMRRSFYVNYAAFLYAGESLFGYADLLQEERLHH